MVSRLRALPLLSLVSLFALGCNESTPPKAPANAPSGPTTSTAPSGPQGSEGPGVNTSTLHVSDDIARLCNLPAPKKEANFAFDSTNIAEDDKQLLTALAKCLTEGPLKGKNIALTGRADARGETEYNMGLGAQRADSVKRYLKGLGVGDERVASTSRGELDATGTDEAGHAKDRRVDISLAK